MSESHCPICYTELLSKKVTPCMECGADEFELDHYLEHSYNEYELFFGLRLVLCDFCDVDFGSYDPAFFGFQSRKRFGFEHFQFIREVTDKTMHYDKYCPKCIYRLPFLKFVMESRRMNEDLKNIL